MTSDEGAREAKGDDAFVVMVNTATEDEAVRIARSVVEERLAAAANVVPGLRSFYRWQGKVEDAAEVQVLMKTRRDRLPRLFDRIEELHSYEVPGIIALPVETGLPAYLRWVAGAAAERAPD